MAKSIKLGSDTYLDIRGIYGLVKAEMPSNANWNDYVGTTMNGIYYVGASSGMTNAAGSWGFLISLTWGVHCQVFISYTGQQIKIRGYSSAGWQAWRTYNPT